MSDTDPSAPPTHALDELREAQRLRETQTNTNVLARAALDVLGVTSDPTGQVTGVLAVQGQDERRLGELERTLRSLMRVGYLVALTCLAIIAWVALGFYDRWEQRQSVAERPQPATEAAL